MTESFTLRLRRVLQAASQVSARFRHNRIVAEHILYGVVLEGDGVGAIALGRLKVNPGRLLKRLEQRLTREPQAAELSEVAPLDPAAQRVLRQAVREAGSLGHRYVGTEHVLLALLRERTGPGPILRTLGVDRRKLKREISRLLFARGDQ